MPIIGSEVLQKNYYRLSISMGGGLTDNVLVSKDGLYSVYYIRNGQYINETGRIPQVVVDYRHPQNSYLLLDYSHDRSSQRERIYFYQVQMIKDITPNNAYIIAVEHGFEGTIEEWLASLKGDPGKSAYEIAVDCGYVGTEEEWLASLKGEKGDPGKNAYEIAVDHGYEGTIEDWMAEFGDTTVIKQDVDILKQTTAGLTTKVTELDTAIEEAKATATEAKTAASQAVVDATAARVASGEAITKANEAKGIATTADEKATEAGTKADEAKDIADGAASLAGDASAKADEAKSMSEEANTKSDTAVAKSEEANTKSEEANVKADEASTKADEAKSSAEEANTKSDTAVAKSTEATEKAASADAKADEAVTKSEEAKTASEEAGTKADAAKTAAEEANEKATEASTKADEAGTKADEAKTAADEAGTKADEANTKADEAGTKADAAKTAADEAGTKADEANTKADEAKTASEEAVTKSEAAKTAAEEASTKADEATQKAEDAASEISKIEKIIDTTEKDPIVIQPDIVPSITNAGEFEVGTQFTPEFSNLFAPGNYEYGPDPTGVVATSILVTDTEGNTSDQMEGTMPTFTITEDSNYRISVDCNHSVGEDPLTNLGNPRPALAIEESHVTNITEDGLVTGARYTFAGAVNEKIAIENIDSDYIRSLAGFSDTNIDNIRLSVPVNTLRFIFATPNDSITRIWDENANMDITKAFKKYTISVAGANGYEAIDYSVYVINFAEPNDTANVYNITL